MYISGTPTMGLATGSLPARKSGKLTPDDAEYWRIRKDAGCEDAIAREAALLAAGNSPDVGAQPSRDLGDEVADLLAQKRGKPSAMAVAAATVLRSRGEHAKADALAPVPAAAVDPLASDPAFDTQDRITIQMLRDRGRHAEADQLIAKIRGAK